MGLNVTMAIAEQVINKMMKTVIGIEDVSNSSSVVNLPLSLLLPEHPLTVDYVLIGSLYSSAVMKSWSNSINSGNWTDVSIFITYSYTYRIRAYRSPLLNRAPPL